MIRFILTASAVTLAIFTVSPLHAGPPAPSSGQGDFMVRHYPPEALKNGEEGSVGFRASISKEGFIEQCEITQSSGYAVLDRETCEFIARYASLKPARDAKGTAYATVQSGIVNWRLPAGVTKSTAPRTAAATLPPALVCKRGQTTGSMLAHATACMTEAEWRYQEALVTQAIDERLTHRTCTVEGC